MHKKFFLQIILLSVVALVSVALALNKPVLDKIISFVIRRDISKFEVTSKLKINNLILDIEVADTQVERQNGLANRESLGANQGMLFIFEKEDKYRFWMKGLTFPLDFIWIKDRQIVDLRENVPAPGPNQSDETLEVLIPKEKIDMVLEVNAGFIREHNTKIGDKVEFVK